MYYAMRASAPSLHRESTDSLIRQCYKVLGNSLNVLVVSVLVKYFLGDQ